MHKGIKTISKEQLEELLAIQGSKETLKDILYEPLETRELMSIALGSTVSKKVKKLCNEEEYLLFDNSERTSSLRVVSKKTINKVLKSLVKEHKEEILRMVCVEEAHNKYHIELHLTEYYEYFINYLQSYILDDINTNWYIELSDYVINYLYILLKDKKINAYIQKNIKSRDEVIFERKKVGIFFDELAGLTKEKVFRINYRLENKGRWHTEGFDTKEEAEECYIEVFQQKHKPVRSYSISEKGVEND